MRAVKGLGQDVQRHWTMLRIGDIAPKSFSFEEVGPGHAGEDTHAIEHASPAQ